MHQSNYPTPDSFNVSKDDAIRNFINHVYMNSPIVSVIENQFLLFYYLEIHDYFVFVPELSKD